MSEAKADDTRAIVREHYGNLARTGCRGVRTWLLQSRRFRNRCGHARLFHRGGGERA
jgi:hypothetical protein